MPLSVVSFGSSFATSSGTPFVAVQLPSISLAVYQAPLPADRYQVLLLVSNNIVKGVLMTRISLVPSTFCRRGSPSMLMSTAGSSTNRIFGGSTLIFSALATFCSVMASEASNRSMSSGSRHLGISVSRSLRSCAPFFSSLTAKRICVTFTSTIVAMRLSRSVSRRVSNQTAPNCGSSDPVNSTDTAARALSMLPSSFSGCGW